MLLVISASMKRAWRSMKASLRWALDAGKALVEPPAHLRVRRQGASRACARRSNHARSPPAEARLGSLSRPFGPRLRHMRAFPRSHGKAADGTGAGGGHRQDALLHAFRRDPGENVASG